MTRRGNFNGRKWRSRLIARDGSCCHYCGVELYTAKHHFRVPPDNLATIDHIIPESEMFLQTLDNMVLACYSCNLRRSDAPYKDFVAMKAINLAAAVSVLKTLTALP